MNLFAGRVNRKTYIIGMMIVLSITAFLALVFLIPLAAIELIVPAFRDGAPAFLDKLVLVIPVLFLVVSSFSLMIRRAHDLESDGFAWLAGLFLALLARILLSSVIASLLPVVVLAALAFRSGSIGKNRYGKKPPKKFKTELLYK